MISWILGKRDWLTSYTAASLSDFAKKEKKELSLIDIDRITWIEQEKCHLQTLYYQEKEITIPHFVIPRLGSQIWGYEIHLLRYLENKGVYILNGPDSILQSVDKFTTYQILNKHNIPFPKTIIFSDESVSLIENKILNYPILIKSLYSLGGNNQFMVNSKEELLLTIKKNESLFKKGKYLVQEFFQESWGRSIRVLVLCDEVVGSLIAIAKNGEYRTNLRRGANLQNHSNLSEEIASLAIRSTRALGLKFSGVDILFSSDNRFLVCEVNSSPGIKGIQTHCNVNVVQKIFEHIESFASGNGDPHSTTTSKFH